MTWQTYLTILAWPFMVFCGLVMYFGTQAILKFKGVKPSKFYFFSWVMFFACLGWLLCK